MRVPSPVQHSLGAAAKAASVQRKAKSDHQWALRAFGRDEIAALKRRSGMEATCANAA
jgi:hypothetical protein